jgi:hypothetical protein
MQYTTYDTGIVVCTLSDDHNRAMATPDNRTAGVLLDTNDGTVLCRPVRLLSPKQHREHRGSVGDPVGDWRKVHSEYLYRRLGCSPSLDVLLPLTQQEEIELVRTPMCAEMLFIETDAMYIEYVFR